MTSGESDHKKLCMLKLNVCFFCNRKKCHELSGSDATWLCNLTVRSEMNLLVLSQPDDDEIYFQDTMSEIVGLSSDMLILNVFQVFGLWGC